MDSQGQLSSQRGLLRECIRIQFPCGPLLSDFLQRNAESHEIVYHCDEYFDGQDGTLLKQNWRLRLRDQKTLSMKVSVESSANEASPIQGRIHFEEITGESQILERIRSHLPDPQRLKKGEPLSLLDLALRPRARFAFVRHVFGTAYGTIYVDEMAVSTKCDDFYVVGTIIVQHTHEIQPALSLLRAMGLNSGTTEKHDGRVHQL
jgi:hypothetical protein